MKKKLEKKDSFSIEDAQNQALRKGREAEFLDVLNYMNRFYEISECNVFYSKNLFRNKERYELYFFFEDEVAIGKSVPDQDSKELVTITRIKYKDVNDVKLIYLDTDISSEELPAILEIKLDNGENIVFDSIKDPNSNKIGSFINKIERIYSLI
ncbi:hypothetical protein COM23_20800 [Bacillus wiedmannii]|uniref:DUF3908 family protein n=1 Tax=Bacillus wiedmannii TaxID=1890302 RepID=UPI000BFA162E|nr:DUF3908 family protein [Bacillus wiedmannii]PGC22741.1 hypothetical protein COM23_20800 [Bacillus wiedmannii]